MFTSADLPYPFDGSLQHRHLEAASPLPQLSNPSAADPSTSFFPVLPTAAFHYGGTNDGVLGGRFLSILRSRPAPQLHAQDNECRQQAPGGNMTAASPSGFYGTRKRSGDEVERKLRIARSTAYCRRRAPRTDRHSKINTAHGPRDRRMRLSLDVARRFFDLQDMLGFDKASNTIEWLLSKSRDAINDLTSRRFPPPPERSIGEVKIDSTTTSECEVISISSTENHEPAGEAPDRTQKRLTHLPKRPKQAVSRPSAKANSAVLHLVQAKETRMKARTRAKERTKEKLRGRGNHQTVDQVLQRSIPLQLEEALQPRIPECLKSFQSAQMAASGALGEQEVNTSYLSAEQQYWSTKHANCKYSPPEVLTTYGSSQVTAIIGQTIDGIATRSNGSGRGAGGATEPATLEQALANLDGNASVTLADVPGEVASCPALDFLQRSLHLIYGDSSFHEYVSS